jgi:integrase
MPSALRLLKRGGRRSNFTNLVRHCKGLLKRGHLPAIRFHNLHHTATTLMLDNGTSLVTVSKILGHTLDDTKAGAIAGLSHRLRRNP